MTTFFLWVGSIVLALLLLSLAIFIHELGHFLVARWLGLRADIFSIGFGPALWKRTIRGTEVRLSAIPFGGYVALPQLDPDAMSSIQGGKGEGAETPLQPAPPWKRILVAAAGPFGNVVLAVVCAVLIFCFAPAEATGASTEIGHVDQKSGAWEAGLRAKDSIQAVNGRAVHSWTEFLTECLISGGSNDVVQLTLERAGETVQVEARLDTPMMGDEGMYTIGGILPGPIHLGVGAVIPGSPAEEAGLKAGEIIETVDGEPFTQFAQIRKRKGPEDVITLTVRSTPEEAVRTVRIAPRLMGEAGEERYMLGFEMAAFRPGQFSWMAERGILAQLRSDAASVLRVLESLTVPKHEGERGRIAKGLGGPLMIVGVLTQVAQASLWACLGFLRLICINLAILNLLPLPVLDGGHILFALYALITRRELSSRIIGWLTNIFLVLLVGVMIWFLYSDTVRMIVPAVRNLFGAGM